MFDRRAIALRALRSVASRSQLVDVLPGEVLETRADQGSGYDRNTLSARTA